MTGTWITPEVNEAVSMGYVIEEIYEVAHWENTSRDLFKDYIDTFMKLKAESSGIDVYDESGEPKEPTDEELEHRVQQFQEHEQVTLDKSNIKDNPGMYKVSKMMLVALGGKLGERQNKPRTKVIDKPGEFYNTISNKRYDCKYEFVGHEGEEMVLMNFTENSNVYNDTRFSTNEALAAFITGYGRLKLYSLLKAVGFENVLYMDTDSVTYKETPENYYVYHGDKIMGPWFGMCKCELKKLEVKHGKCIEFVATNDKSYSMKFEDGHTSSTLSGFPINPERRQNINHDVMRDMVIGTNTRPVSIKERVIRHQSKSLGLETRIQSKTFSYTPYDKGVEIDDYVIVPLG